jgi:RNA polymerase sigma-70 factor (ECF subfamily)
MAHSRDEDLATFERYRPELVALAYRMLGDFGRAQDTAQEAWLRWEGRGEEARSPRAYLVTLVTRLCLNELASARTRREEARGDRLPEPVDLEAGGIGQLESLEEVSMAFLVVLQRLAAVERAVFLLHEVFDFSHREIARLVGKSEAACRKVLERATRKVAAERHLFAGKPDEEAAHERLLAAFLQAAYAGDVAALAAMLAEDAVFTSDGGSFGARIGGLRNLAAPLHGPARIAAFVVEATRRAGPLLDPQQRNLNGQPAIVLFRGESPFAAILVSVAAGKIHRIFFHGDVERLRFVDPPSRRPPASARRPS